MIYALTDVSNRVPSRRTHMRGSVVSLRREDWVQKLDDWFAPKDTTYINLQI